MNVIISSQLSHIAKKSLSKYVEHIFEIEDYPYILDSTGLHPDIHFAYVDGILFYNPFFENFVKNITNTIKIETLKGSEISAYPYPADVSYNVLVNDNFVFHNFKYTEARLLEHLEKSGRRLIKIKQGYANCSSILLEHYLISSDLGVIEKANQQGFSTFFIDDSEIILEDFNHGFLGGCIGKYANQIFVTGHFSFHKWGDKLQSLLTALGYTIVFLDNGPLTDVGSLLFLD